MRRLVFAALAGVVAAGAAAAVVVAAPPAQSDPVSIPKRWTARERAVAEAVTPTSLRAHTRLLADDLLEGRAPGSRGDAMAMAYVRSQLERLGFEPGAPGGSWVQKFGIVGLSTTVVKPPVVSGPAGSTPITLSPPNDSIVAAGTQTRGAKIDGAEIVFVGYGITAPEQNWDDWKGVDVRGKVVLVMNNDPESDPSLFAGKTRLYYGRWTYKYEEAARHGAAAAIIIHTEPSAGYPWRVVQTSWSGDDFELPDEGEPRVHAKMWVTEERARAIARLGGKDLDALRAAAEKRDFRPVPLGVRLSTEIATKVTRLETANVLGLLRGSDPKLADEVVVYTAHHDHLGVRAPPPGSTSTDGIYNGALDNASGVAAILSIAEGLARATPRPKRSILIAAVGVEESGLLGSEYYARHPTVAAGRIAANINVDGVNIYGRTRDIEIIGLGKSSLDEVVTAVAGEQGRVVRPDQFPDRGHFYRSDQFNFARIGVPALYLKGGLDVVGKPAGWARARIDEYVKTHYHQPSDELRDDWTFDGAVDDMRLLAVVGLRIADAPRAPAWRPGDEFEAARKKALAELH
jgi:Zn-dependent M28 family amino/carboxypeptidase